MSMIWVGIGTAVLGAGVNYMGQQQQKKSNAAAIASNEANQDKQNNSAWQSYLLSRGVNPAGATAGNIPGNAQAVNTKLPLWAVANFKTPGGSTGWRKKGSAAGTLAPMPAYATGAPAVDPNASAAAADGKVSGTQRVANFLDPLNVSVGKNKNFLDPLGLF